MQGDLDIVIDMLPFLIPLLLLELALLAIALVDLVRREHVTGGNKVVWIIVIILVNIIGPIIYLIFGRKEAPPLERD
jgi:hypothetical protein